MREEMQALVIGDQCLHFFSRFFAKVARIAKTEQVSKNRFHNELNLTAPGEIDEELLGWLKDAYALG